MRLQCRTALCLVLPHPNQPDRRHYEVGRTMCSSPQCYFFASTTFATSLPERRGEPLRRHHDAGHAVASLRRATLTAAGAFLTSPSVPFWHRSPLPRLSRPITPPPYLLYSPDATTTSRPLLPLRPLPRPSRTTPTPTITLLPPPTRPTPACPAPPA
ncbi:hypothetical protein E2C01_007113 [Portunus trituberculatus]|uniref:Uncharacterized protein n=1 Tax=Portunus trituberculatus TaxID=210409 RepID=A0A5B7CYA8_PORTR|nr:hypothetical protein [Portunus trituberculatus]